MSQSEDADELSTLMAVKAVFDRDPARAYDHFEDRLRAPGSPAVAKALLKLLSPSSFGFAADGRRVPDWRHEPRAPGWLKQDPRWLELCARLRHDETFRGAARDVLRYADRDDVLAALGRVRDAEAQQQPARTERAGDLPARYRSGEFEAVWREIGLHRRIGGEYRDAVLEVAAETMRRVARNANLLSERLQAKGWRALSGRLRTYPSAADVKVIETIERTTGSPIPPTLHAFWTVVGGIDWVWDYRAGDACPDLGVALPMAEMDPLCVHPPDEYYTHRCGEWEEERRDDPDPDLAAPFCLDLSPDLFHKADYSGGGPYGFELPRFKPDPVFEGERHELPFVDYLRLCFRWAGFPELDRHADRQDVQRFVREFARGLEPF